MDDTQVIKDRLERVISAYSHIGMTWHDVLNVSSQLRAKKVQEILTSTLNSLSLQELCSCQAVAYAHLQPPSVSVTPLPSAAARCEVAQPIPPVAEHPVKVKRKGK